MVQLGEAIVKIRTDDSDVDKSVEHTKSKISGLGGALSSAFSGVASGLGAVAGIDSIAGALTGAISAASDANEVLSKSNTIFKDQASAIEAWASGGAKDFGLSKTAALDAASSFGNMFTQLGIGVDAAADMSTATTELAADFASFHNADITDVIAAQQAAFRGEYDSVQRFLPTLNAASVEQRALAMTGKESTKELTAQEKALAVNKLMFEGAGEAMGDFDKTAGGLANRQRILSAEFTNIKTNIGAQLLPVMVTLSGFVLNTLIPAVTKVANTVTSLLKPAFDTIIGIAKTLISYFSFIAEEGDYLNDSLADLPGPIKGIVKAFGEVFAVITNILKLKGGLKDFWADPIVALTDGIGLSKGFASAIANVVVMIRDKLIPAVVAFVSNEFIPYITGTVLPALLKWINILKEVAINILTFGANLVQTIAKIAQFAVESGLLTVIWEGIKTIISVVIPVILFLGEMIKKVTDFLSENKVVMYIVIAALAALLVALFPIPAAIIAIIAVVGLLSKAWDMIETKTREIWNSLPGPIQAALDFIKDYVMTRIQGIIQIFTSAWEIIKNVVSLFANLITGDWAGAWNNLKNIASAAIDLVIGYVHAVFGNLPDIMLNIALSAINFVKDNFDKLPGIAVDAFNSLINAIGEAAPGAWKAAKDLAQGILDSVWDVLKGLFNTGKDAISELLNGFMNGIRDVGGVISSFIRSAIPGAIRTLLGIGSPSKVMFDIGKYIIQGLINGIKKVLPRLASEAARAAGIVWDYLSGVGGTVKNAAGEVLDSALNVVGLAGGGPAMANKPYIVGENGWELMVPNQNGTVLSHADSVAATSGSGQNVNFYGATIYAQDMMDAQRSAGDFGWAIRLRSRGLAYGG